MLFYSGVEVEDAPDLLNRFVPVHHTAVIGIQNDFFGDGDIKVGAGVFDYAVGALNGGGFRVSLGDDGVDLYSRPHWRIQRLHKFWSLRDARRRVSRKELLRERYR